MVTIKNPKYIFKNSEDNRKFIFRTPLRRQIRQKSGFNVMGNTPGSECKIKKTGRLNIENKTFNVTFFKTNFTLTPLFNEETGIICFGGYIKPKENLKLTLNIKVQIDQSIETNSKSIVINKNQWNKIGILVDTKIIQPVTVNYSSCELKLLSNNENIGIIDIFGINIGSIDYPYLIDNDVSRIFYENIQIYIPEISYQNYDKLQSISCKDQLKFMDGEPIILKSCNRCSRFLPIDILNERNTLSFSNHCVKKAPCTHDAFSKYSIKENDYGSIPEIVSHLVVDNKITLLNGYQLECKPCKKFFVNAPLNPLRNSSQHREDSLRRRAIEILVDTLLEREWIYHKFKLEKKKEFDLYVWEKFEKKCFKCNKSLETERKMDLDHTMPLASFWPLDESATCLCKACNSLKSDKFPVDFYSEKELIKLSEITKIPHDLITKRKANIIVIKLLIEKVDWFFDEFLNNNDYQKVRENKRTSDLIYKAIIKQIKKYYAEDIDLIKLYKDKTKELPKTITI